MFVKTNVRKKIRAHKEARKMDINIICFIAATALDVACILLAIKEKPPGWKFLVIWEIIMEIVAILLLASRLKIWIFH